MYREFGINTEIVGNKEILLMISNRFLGQVVEEVVKHPDTETAGYILGVRDSSDPKRTFLVPIASFTPKNPDEVSRQGAHINMGSMVANLYRKWQVENWNQSYPSFYKDFPFNRDNPNTKLSLLGIWHRHPGSFISYSGEDNDTINNILAKSGKEDFIFPIVIVESRSKHLNQAQDINTLTINAGKDYIIKINHYFRSRNGKTQILKPEIYNQQLFPQLSDSPWYAENPIKFKEEQQDFQRLGFDSEIVITKASRNQKPDIWLKLTNSNFKRTIFIKTSLNFHKDRTFYIKYDNPQPISKDDVGFILPEVGNRTIAEVIEPILLFELDKQNK